MKCTSVRELCCMYTQDATQLSEKQIIDTLDRNMTQIMDGGEPKSVALAVYTVPSPFM